MVKTTSYMLRVQSSQNKDYWPAGGYLVYVRRDGGLYMTPSWRCVRDLSAADRYSSPVVASQARDSFFADLDPLAPKGKVSKARVKATKQSIGVEVVRVDIAISVVIESRR